MATRTEVVPSATGKGLKVLLILRKHTPFDWYDYELTRALFTLSALGYVEEWSPGCWRLTGEGETLLAEMLGL